VASPTAPSLVTAPPTATLIAAAVLAATLLVPGVVRAVPVPASGTPSLQASSADAHEPNDTLAQATPITADGTFQEHTFYPAGDIDWVTFQAVAGKTYVIETFKSGTDTADTRLELFDEDGRLLKANDNKDWSRGDRYSRIRWTATQNGPMAVRATYYEGNSSATPAYRISVTEQARSAATRYIPVEGADRYKTAIAASKNAFPLGADAAVIATGENFPDALGGAALAGAVTGPILLTPKNGLSADVLAEVRRLKATSVYILGSEAAVSAAMQNALNSEPGIDVVYRIAGADRYDTANKVAAEVIRLMGSGYQGGAFVATGANFPDALGASPVAAARAWPVLLAKPGTASVTLPPEVALVIIVGGDNVVSQAIETDLRKQLDTSAQSMVFRFAGADRFETAALVAEMGVLTLDLDWDGVGVATGMDFPDALGAGPVLARAGTALLLTRSNVLPPITGFALDYYKSEVDSVHFFGSTAAVSALVRDQVKSILF